MRYWYQVFRGKGLRASAAYVAAAIAVRTVSLGNRVHVADICYLFRGTTDAQHRDCLRLFAKSTCGSTNDTITNLENEMRYQPGTRVSWYCWHSRREGIVLDQRSRGIVWVRDDVSGRVSWRHLASLTPLHYTPEQGYMV